MLFYPMFCYLSVGKETSLRNADLFRKLNLHTITRHTLRYCTSLRGILRVNCNGDLDATRPHLTRIFVEVAHSYALQQCSYRGRMHRRPVLSAADGPSQRHDPRTTATPYDDTDDKVW
jgi:hypothetical protein